MALIWDSIYGSNQVHRVATMPAGWLLHKPYRINEPVNTSVRATTSLQ